MRGIDVSAVGWRKSSYSNSDGGECIEVADGLTPLVPVRDSKVPHGPVLVFPADRWSVFVAAVGAGRV
ncbi:DUF397 domain-containing protein [Streptomyces tropicalis]|uniref:DUF397 domain-containing protein n=1 Tax=Streptomyces tropicalis TaxID=3034234 RepID=A0ABT6A192_9ACTN|nr:DUF397 domain-containing protein [Streptomyces tropicalis]MDF3298410.1 DUF397 domain-containing protein [Streptomyces tropicalis]